MHALLTHSNVKQLAKDYQEYARYIRRFLHQYPELAWNEERTLTFLLQEIQKYKALSPLQIDIHEKFAGFYVDVTIDKNLPRLLFRADCDALPIQEETHLEYASKNPGVMHACGHDFHCAMLLAAFRAIVEHQLPLSHNLRFVFQRAEEIGNEKSGGKIFVQEGVCAGVAEAFALHIITSFESGVFYTKPNELMANTTLIDFEVECKGGHVMRPYLGSNAIDIQTELALALRGFDRLHLEPTDPVTFIPSFSQSGVANNVRPNHLKMTYAFRNFLRLDKRRQFVEAVENKVSSVVSSFKDAKLSAFRIIDGYPVLSNDPEQTKLSTQMLQYANLPVQPSPLLFAGEDFAYYLQQTPGSYWCLGAMQGEKQDHHTPSFNPNEDVLHLGVAFWLLLATEYPSLSSL